MKNTIQDNNKGTILPPTPAAMRAEMRRLLELMGVDNSKSSVPSEVFLKVLAVTIARCGVPQEGHQSKEETSSLIHGILAVLSELPKNPSAMYQAVFKAKKDVVEDKIQSYTDLLGD